MVQLFLSESNWESNVVDDSTKSIISLLNKLDSIIWPLMTSGGRSEARLWLCNTISNIGPLGPNQKREIFGKLLRSKRQNCGLASQLFQMIFEKRPRRAGIVLAKKSFLLKKFFEGNPRCIMQWFSNFSDDGGTGHQKGAKALAQFAFVNRDICWEELEWKGKHGQSPAMVATKPHYFLDLDVQRTVENFLDNVPEFWSSKEFAESLKDGEVLSLDTKYFVELFTDMLYKEGTKDAWDVIDEFLMEESFSSLCQRLLIIIGEHDFIVFLKSLHKYVNPKLEPKDFDSSSYWLEIILSRSSDFESIDQLLLLNAVINKRHQLLSFLHDEEYHEEQAKIKDIISQIYTISNKLDSLVSIFGECLSLNTIQAIKLLGIFSWIIYCRLSEDSQSPESWESLFVSNGIQFRRSDKYALLVHDRLSGEGGSDLDDGSSRRKRKKKKKNRKKRRRNYDDDDDDNYDSELMDFDTSSTGVDLQSRAVSWFLSTDGFSSSWTSGDLPEHLSKYCLSKWMKWLVTKWNNAT